MNITDMKIGGNKRKMTITKVEVQDRKTQYDTLAPKVIFTCMSTEGREFELDETITKDNKQKVVLKGLWLTQDMNKNISKNSPLAKTLAYYDAKIIDDIINKEIETYPKKNNFLVLVGCEFDESEIPWV